LGEGQRTPAGARILEGPGGRREEGGQCK